MILLTGATGNIGGAALRHLAGGPTGVRALLRDVSRPPLAAPNITYVQGDFADPASLDRALGDGIETVFIVSGFEPTMVELKRNLIRAAARARVSHVVLSSGADADSEAPSPTHLWLGETEDDLKASGLAWTILRPSTFMQNFLGQAAKISAGGALSAAVGDSTVTLIDARDIGAVAAIVLADPARHKGQVYELTGLDTLSHSAIAQAIGAVTGQTVHFVAVAPEEVRRAAEAAGQSPTMAEAAIAAQQYRLAGHIPPITGTVEALLGRPPVRFDAFLREFADAFTLGAKP